MDGWQQGADTVARQFSDLWSALVNDGEGRRPDEQRVLLINSVRDALDRGECRLAPPPAGIIANTFVLAECVHDGAITQVHHARHRDLQTSHAIKTLRAERSSDPVAHRLLLREAEIGLALRHPHIVATQALLRLEDGRPALVMEWCDRTLAERLADGPFAPAEIRQIMAAMLSGLAAIHDISVVHCDLSPANLFFDGRSLDRLKIGDFSIAVSSGSRHAESDLAFAGQSDFAGPEQIDGRPLDGRADLYAAGRILALLVQHCSDAGSLDGLRQLADHLAQARPEDRPETAKIALDFLAGVEP